MLTKIELTKGFANFIGKLKSSRAVTDPSLLTLTPPRNMMI
jgi:hypothetical protein